MIDFELIDGQIVFSDTTVHKAANVLQTQENSLYYAPNFGIDIARFFNPDIDIQTETFKAYSVERLTQCGVNVISLLEEIHTLDALLTYGVSMQDSEGLGNQ